MESGPSLMLLHICCAQMSLPDQSGAFWARALPYCGRKTGLGSSYGYCGKGGSGAEERSLSYRLLIPKNALKTPFWGEWALILAVKSRT
jgi:hypothetical protein